VEFRKPHPTSPGGGVKKEELEKLNEQRFIFMIESG